MRYLSIPLSGLLALLFGLSACKRSEEAPSAAPRAEVRSSSESETAPASGVATPATPQTSGDAKDAIVLQAKWPVGNRYIYRMDLEQQSTNKIPMMPKPMEQNVTMAMTYALSVLKEAGMGGREVELEFLANEMEVKMGEQVMMSFDSKESSQNDAQNPFAGPFRKMIGSKIRFQTDASGRIDKVIGHKEWLDGLMQNAGPMGGMLSQQFGEGFIRQVAGFGAALPEKPVQVGETWPFKMDMPSGPMGKMEIEAKVTLKNFEEHEQRKCAVLDFAGTLQGSGLEAGPMGKMSVEGGKLTGTSWFEPEVGALIESVSDQSMRMQGEMPGQPGANAGGAKFTIDLGQKVTVKLAELGKTAK